MTLCFRGAVVAADAGKSFFDFDSVPVDRLGDSIGWISLFGVYGRVQSGDPFNQQGYNAIRSMI